jgi:hypothetical protein
LPSCQNKNGTRAVVVDPGLARPTSQCRQQP